MLTPAHPASTRGRLEAYGYAFAPSFRRQAEEAALAALRASLDAAVARAGR